MTKPDKAEPAKPAHPAKPDKPAGQPAAGVIDFELSMVRTDRHDDPSPPAGGRMLVHLLCLACGGTADDRKRKPVLRAADVHARDDHHGAKARVRSVSPGDA